MKLKLTFKQEVFGFIGASIIIGLLAVPFWIFGGWKWGISAHTILIFYLLMKNVKRLMEEYGNS